MTRAWDEPRCILDTPVDDRDPALLVSRDEMVCLFTSRAGDEVGETRRAAMAARSADGRTFTAPAPCFQPGWTPFRPIAAENGFLMAFYDFDPLPRVEGRGRFAQAGMGAPGGWIDRKRPPVSQKASLPTAGTT